MMGSSRSVWKIATPYKRFLGTVPIGSVPSAKKTEEKQKQLEEQLGFQAILRVYDLELKCGIKNVKTYIKRIMFHMVRMNLDKLLKHPEVYELLDSIF